MSGNEDLAKYTVTGNVPVSDTVALRASALVNKRDGTVYNTTLDRDEGGVDSRVGGQSLRALNLMPHL